MQALWNTVSSALNATTTMFSAIEKAAVIADVFADVGVIKANTYKQEAQNDQALAIEEFAYERAKRKAKLDAKLKALAADAKAPAALPAP